MAGTAISPLTTAYPIRWVKLTLPPVVRNSWLLTMVRLTSSSLAGTTRTLVAVGTPERRLHVGHDAAGRAPQRCGAPRDRTPRCRGAVVDGAPVGRRISGRTAGHRQCGRNGLR